MRFLSRTWLLIFVFYIMYFLYGEGRDSLVGTATGYGMDGSGFESRCGRDFTHPSRPAMGAHPTS